VNRDDNRVSPGGTLAVLAFVPDADLARITTTTGLFVVPNGPAWRKFDTSLSCGPNVDIDDVDCYPGWTGAGDGVVEANLFIPPDTPRGPGHVTVTQGTNTFGLDFFVTGPPAAISIEKVDTNPFLEPADTGCSYPGTLRRIVGMSENGIRDEHASAYIARVVDADGNAVVGALPAALDPDPAGPKLLAGTGTFDLGPQGIGAPMLVCAGTETGDFTLDVRLPDTQANDVHVLLSVRVGAPPPPTDTATATPSFTPTATPTPPACVGDVNGSGLVNSLDLLRIARHFTGLPGSQNHDSMYDVDHNGAINSADLALAATHFGKCPAAAPMR
jgi:hypothetical protein